jgi:hypothetical protein
MADYKQTSRYGFLIVNFVPFSLVSFIFTPLLFVIKKESTLEFFN